MEHPNSAQRDVESGEKSHCGVESFTGNQQPQEPEHGFLGESAPHAGFTHSCLPGLPGSCRAALPGKQFPVPRVCPGTLELPGPAQGRQQQNSLLRGVSPSSSPGHVPCALSSSRGGFLSGINCLNPSALLKNTGGWEEDLLEQLITSAKHVILKLS